MTKPKKKLTEEAMSPESYYRHALRSMRHQLGCRLGIEQPEDQEVEPSEDEETEEEKDTNE